MESVGEATAPSVLQSCSMRDIPIYQAKDFLCHWQPTSRDSYYVLVDV